MESQLDSVRYYDLDALQEWSEELGFSCSRLSHDELGVSVEPDVLLIFQNLRDDEDTMLGFGGTSWHSHGPLTLMLQDGSMRVRLRDADFTVAN